MITATPTSLKDDSELGPWNVTAEEYDQIVSEGQKLYDAFMKTRAPQAPACCSPDQWEGYEFSWDPRHHFRAGMNISYGFILISFSLFFSILKSNFFFKKRFHQSKIPRSY